MTNSRPTENGALSAAECAARTGLTIRALRVYERIGLIDPPRTPNGWRQYGERELTRLSTISVLKATGLTLSQIQSILHGKDVPLRALIEAQVESWRVKQDQAERGRILAEAVLRRIYSSDAVTIDELCELIKSRDSGSTDPALRPLVLRMLDLLPEERTGAIKRHNETLSPAWLQEYQEALRAQIDPDLEQLMDEGIPSTSPRVQELVARQLKMMTDYRVREEVTRWLRREEPPDETSGVELLPGLRKELVPGIRAVLKQRPTDSSPTISHQWTANPFLAPYFSDAESVSAQCRELDSLVSEAQGTLRGENQMGSGAADALIERLKLICRAHALGNPLTYATWAALARPPPPAISAADDSAAWEALAEAMRPTTGARGGHRG